MLRPIPEMPSGMASRTRRYPYGARPPDTKTLLGGLSHAAAPVFSSTAPA